MSLVSALASGHPVTALSVCKGLLLVTALYVTADGWPGLQVAKQPGRRSCAGLRVLARRHLDGSYSLWYGTRRLGRCDRHGRALQAA